MEIMRNAQKDVIQGLNDNKVVIVYGARQVGKTTLVKQVGRRFSKHLYLTSDDSLTVEYFSRPTLGSLKSLIADNDLLIIDEAQRIKNIGLALKLLHDGMPELKIIATGSSSFDLSNKINEPLTGRKHTVLLSPLSISEISTNAFEKIQNADISLIRGTYPAFWGLPLEKAKRELVELSESYVYKDIFAPNTIYDQTVLLNLMRLLAFQIGNEVSYNELSRTLGIAKDTVIRYIDLLEKAFIIFRLNQFRRNERSEVGRLRKVYFYDVGIRNALIGNFLPLNARNDTGALWENYCICEMIKRDEYKQNFTKSFYWRDNKKHEIDYIEENSSGINAYEFKYNESAKYKLPTQFPLQHPDYNDFAIINRRNFVDYF